MMTTIDDMVQKPDGILVWVRRSRGNTITFSRELWIPCRAFAERIHRPYTTVLSWLRSGKIPAREIGIGRYSVCIVPVKRALQAYAKLRRRRKPALKKL